MSTRLFRVRPIRFRLPVGAIGLALALMVAAAWATGSWYLAARLGASSPLGLARMDGVHAYVGLVAGVLVLAKVLRVGLRTRVPGVPGVLLWHRWLSCALLALYATIFVSGCLLLTPIHGRAYNDLTEIHLLASVWALVPTGWHVWHYRHRALPYLRRRLWRRRRRMRFWLGLGLIVPAACVLALEPRAASQLPMVMGGETWSPGGPPGTAVIAIAASGDGRTLLAGGDALYFSQDGLVWTGLGLPSPSPVIETVAGDGAGVFAGTSGGLYYADSLRGPLRLVGFGGQEVRAVAPAGDGGTVVVATASGLFLSRDRGAGWNQMARGLPEPRQVRALAWFGDRLFAGDAGGVSLLAPGASSWRRVLAQPGVTALTVDPSHQRLYATSAQHGVEMLEGGRWTALAAPGPAHHAGMGMVPAMLGGALAGGSRVYVPGTDDGVSASADGGRTWTQLGGGLDGAMPVQLVEFQGRIWAATDRGVFSYRLTPAPPPSPPWWLLLIGAGLGCGVLGTLVAVLDRGRRRPG